MMGMAGSSNVMLTARCGARRAVALTEGGASAPGFNVVVEKF
jgi:hypothetical protein